MDLTGKFKSIIVKMLSKNVITFDIKARISKLEYRK